MKRGWTVRSGSGFRSGPTIMWRGTGGRNVPCEGLIGQFDYPRAEVRLSIPRNCLGDAPWVQASLRLETYRYSPRPYRYMEDRWPRLGPPPDFEETFSPRVLAP